MAHRIEEERQAAPFFADSRHREAAANVAQDAFTFIPPVVREPYDDLPEFVETTPLLQARLSKGPVSQRDCFGPKWEEWRTALAALEADWRASMQGQQFCGRRTIKMSVTGMADFFVEAVDAGIYLEFISGGENDGRVLLPSTAADTKGDTVFPGSKLDTANWARVASLVGSRDYDIQRQGVAGVRMRTTPARAIMVHFPHPGLIRHMDLARPKIEAEIAKGWSMAPIRHAPFLPMTVNPRDCILQPKFKEDDLGELVAYDGVRVTTDLSAGGDEAPNSGIEDVEATLQLPKVQEGCHAGAVINAVFQGKEVAHRETAHVDIRVLHFKKADRPPAGRRGRTIYVHIDRAAGGVLGNPFRMGPTARDETMRDRVCDAHRELIRQPCGASIRGIAERHGIPEECIDQRWLRPGTGRRLMDALVRLVDAAREGLHIIFLCGVGCRQRRCHGHNYADFVSAHALVVGVDSGQADLSSAYYAVMAQRLDWPRQVFLWPQWASGSTTDTEFLGFCVATRLVFGGRHGPNRFDRIGAPPLQLAYNRIVEFERMHPPEGSVMGPLYKEWLMGRPNTPEQRVAAYLKKFIDDLEVKALNDRVPIPEELRHIEIPRDLTISMGFVPSHPASRAAVYLRFLIDSFQTCGFTVAKIQCGSGGVDLGLEISMPRARLCDGLIRVPAVKRWTMLRTIDDLSEAVAAGTAISTRTMEQLTGRLSHISQVEPAIIPMLRAGYAVANARYRGKRRGQRVERVLIRTSSRVGQALHEMFGVARTLLQNNRGVPLAPAATFRCPRDPSVCVFTTDASGVHGFGGFAFHPTRPRVVWLLSEWWPAWALAAIQAAAAGATAPDATERRPALSMPAAELFAAWTMGAIMRLILGDSLQWAIAVGDCKPACAAINRESSPVDQIRLLLVQLREVCPQWLAVHVGREFNRGADELSHPDNLAAMAEELSSLGWIVTRVHVPERCWTVLREAIALGLGHLGTDTDDLE